MRSTLFSGFVEAVLDHHLAALRNSNLDEVLSDYTDESILITPKGVIHGIAGLKSVFEGIFEEFGKPGASFKLHTKIVEGEMAYIIWSAETADNVYEFATDTFLVQDAKIMRQSSASKITPKN